MSMELGDMLRKQREKKKLSFEDISEKTKISKTFLAAFEEQRFELLPPEPFASGFVKNYAMVLSLNPEEVYELYRATRYGAQQELFSSAPVTPEEHIPTITDVDEKPTYPRTILIVLGVLGVAIAGFFVYRCCGSSCMMKCTARAQHASTVSQQSKQAIVVSTHSVSQTTPRAKKEQIKVAPVVASGQKAVTQEKKNKEQDNQNQNKNKDEKQNQQSQQEQKNSKAEALILEAEGTSECWIEVRADNQKPSRVMLNASETKMWNAREKFVLKVGNVRGVIVKINGIPLDVEKGNYKGVNTITIDKKKIEELKHQ